MIHSAMPLIAQAPGQPVADSPTVSPYSGGAAWIDDLFALVIVYGY